MSTENKHHYRNVFKSDHLGSADLEDLIEKGHNLCFTIKEVKANSTLLIECIPSIYGLCQAIKHLQFGKYSIK